MIASRQWCRSQAALDWTSLKEAALRHGFLAQSPRMMPGTGAEWAGRAMFPSLRLHLSSLARLSRPPRPPTCDGPARELLWTWIPQPCELEGAGGRAHSSVMLGCFAARRCVVSSPEESLARSDDGACSPRHRNPRKLHTPDATQDSERTRPTSQNPASPTRPASSSSTKRATLSCGQVEGRA